MMISDKRIVEMSKSYGKLIIEGSASNITIGDDCAFNKYVLLEAGENIHIGNNVVFSAFSQVHTSSLDITKASSNSNT